MAKANATEHLTRQLRQRIHSGQWPVGMRLPSVRQLCGESGVSINTVQRALARLAAERLIESRQRRPSVVRAWRSRIVPLASSVQTQIGVLVESRGRLPEPGRSWSGSILASARQALAHRRQALAPLAIPARAATQQIIQTVRDARDQFLGLICFETHWSDELIEELDQLGLPWTMINRPHRAWLHNFVTANHFEAGSMLSRLFLDRGQKRIVVLGANMSQSVMAIELITGMVHEFVDQAVPLNTLNYLTGERAGLGMRDWAAREVAGYLRSHAPPQAIVCLGDWEALGAIDACQSAGLRVPRDIGVVGCTGLPFSARTTPALTVLGQPIRRIGVEAVNMILKMHREGRRRIPGTVLPTRLVMRDTLQLPEANASRG
jgi:LacI family transcriptional regulator